MEISLCPSSCIKAGRLTPRRSISVAKVCRNRCGVTRLPQATASAARLKVLQRVRYEPKNPPERGSSRPTDLVREDGGSPCAQLQDASDNLPTVLIHRDQT